MGLRLPAFHTSIRKSQLLVPKFYWFDLGVQRFLSGTIHAKPILATGAFGESFESFVTNEILRYNTYYELDYRLSYLQTKDDAEVDLVLSRGRETIAVTIKSTTRVDWKSGVYSMERFF